MWPPSIKSPDLGNSCSYTESFDVFSQYGYLVLMDILTGLGQVLRVLLRTSGLSFTDRTEIYGLSERDFLAGAEYSLSLRLFTAWT